jgi:hypothetical protein
LRLGWLERFFKLFTKIFLLICIYTIAEVHFLLPGFKD